MKVNFKSIVPHLLAIVVFVMVAVIYFLPQIQGKVIKSGDIVSYKAMVQEVKAYEEKTGNVSLWTNSMFGGMPTYQINNPQRSNLLKPVQKLQQLYISRPIGYFVGGMIGFYLLLIFLGVGPVLGAFGALAFAFSTNNLILFEAGHMSKLISIFSMPLVLIGVFFTLDKKYLMGGVIFGVGLGINILNNHLQMTYLLAILLAILMILYFVKYLKEHELSHFTKVVAIFILASVLALASSGSKIWTTYEYAKDTMRGTPILKSESSTPASSSETKGLEWNYAMQWSNGWKDLLSSFIPGAVGGGSSEAVSPKSAFALEYKKMTRGRSVKNLSAPLYWGDLPFTSGPIYFGALMFFLFFFGALIVKGPVKWWLVSGVVLTMMFSLGNNLEWFNRMMFDYFPMFNKFRTPNSILSITVLLVPILGILGLKEIIESKDKTLFITPLFIAAGIVGGISLLLAIIGPSIFDFSAPGDDRWAEMNLLDAIIADRRSLLINDSLKSFAYIGLGTFTIWLFLMHKLKALLLVSIIGLIAVIDLISVDLRYINHADFSGKSRSRKEFSMREVDKQILQDTDPYYRVLDMSINTFNSSIPSYYHHTIGGYHAAKLQRYQDIIEHHISKGNQQVLNMLNTKYIISGQAGKEKVVKNQFVLGNAWFVDSLVKVADANEEIDKLTDFNPAKLAIYHDEFKDYIKSFQPDKKGIINLESYAPDRLVYSCRTPSEQFAVFSEIWYGPDKGWNAYLDGKPVDFIRVNYVLRGMRVPAGKHEIIFEFSPKSYLIGEKISLAGSGILLLLLIGMFAFRAYKYYRG